MCFHFHSTIGKSHFKWNQTTISLKFVLERRYKFSLVEFVKELLNPTWKDGKITKEDYKAIVKKVTDKVIDTVQGAHIPQTQEKIDCYLSSSKSKLNKLVQVSGGSPTNFHHMYEEFQILS